MLDLTFGEQVKIILSRRGMTIKQLAEIIEERTGKKMSRQNLTQRLGRDNFQEQDMRMIASILECPLELSILGDMDVSEAGYKPPKKAKASQAAEDKKENINPVKSTSEEETHEKGVTVGEFLDMQKGLDEDSSETLLKEVLAEMDALEREGEERSREKDKRQEQSEPEKKSGWRSYLRFRKKDEAKDVVEVSPVEEVSLKEEVLSEEVPQAEEVSSVKREEASVNIEDIPVDAFEGEEDLQKGDINPYTGREYASNSVRSHPNRIGYVQVYDRREHKWTDMTEWAFLGYQERKKVLLGKEYEPPIYLD